jgi:hypothetical protein
MPTNVPSAACDKDALCVVINLKVVFLLRLRRTLSGSGLAAAYELDASPFTIAILRVSARLGWKTGFGTRLRPGSIPIT